MGLILGALLKSRYKAFGNTRNIDRRHPGHKRQDVISPRLPGFIEGVDDT